MSDLKVGQVASIKISGEPVFIMAIHESELPSDGLSGIRADVRRLNASQKTGFNYETLTFLIEELEDTASLRKKQIDEAGSIAAQWGVPSANAGDLARGN